MNKIRRKKWLVRVLFLLAIIMVRLGIGGCLEVNAANEFAMPNCTTYVLGRIYEITGKNVPLVEMPKSISKTIKQLGHMHIVQISIVQLWVQ